MVVWYSTSPATTWHNWETYQLLDLHPPATFELTQVGSEGRRIRTSPLPCQLANLPTFSILPGYSKGLKGSGLKMGAVWALGGYSL